MPNLLNWQSRFWERTIRDESDFENHVNYIHYNPVICRRFDPQHQVLYHSTGLINLIKGFLMKTVFRVCVLLTLALLLASCAIGGLL